MSESKTVINSSWQDFVDDPNRFTMVGDIVADTVARRLRGEGYLLDTVLRDLTDLEEYTKKAPFSLEGYGIVVVCAPAIIHKYEGSDRTAQVPLMLENAGMLDTPTIVLPFTGVDELIRERYDFVVDGITNGGFIPEIAMPSLYDAMKQCVEIRRTQLGR